MAIKNIICQGVGFSAGSTKWIPTAGFSIQEAAPPADVTWHNRQARQLGQVSLVKHPFITRNY